MSQPELLCISILFISTLTRATFGFGDALIAMPLLTLVVGVKVATPLVAFIATTIAMTIFWEDWHKVEFSAAWQLILSSFIGIPFGLIVLKIAPEAWVQLGLGLFIMLFGLYNLIRPALVSLEHPFWAYTFGFVAGVLGGAYNTNGPPIVVYATMRRWPPDRFRATLQGYFLPTGTLILLGHGVAGLWTRQVFGLYLLALPGVISAIYLGNKLNERIPTAHFEKLLYLVLIALGALLLLR